MILKLFLKLGVAFLIVPELYAQKTWSLQDCIDYAIAHSFQLEHQNNAVKIAAQELSTSRNSMLPSLSGNTYQDFTFGRGLSAENTYTSTDVRTTAFAIAAELPIFTGFRISNTVKQKQHLYQASLYDVQKIENELRILVTKAYQDVLYKQEDMNICYKQFEVDSLQTERVKVLVERGKSSKIELVRQISAQSQSKTKYIQSTNAMEMSRLILSQLMELSSCDNLHLAVCDLPIESMCIEKPEDVYESAITNKAEIKAEEHRLKAYERQVRISQSSLYPSISLTGGVGSKYYLMSGVPNIPFGRQIKNNLSKYVTLNMTIPIFNRFETRNCIRKNRIEYENQQLALKERKKDLYKTIQQTYYTALDAQNRYAACKETVASAEESLRLVIAKYENGLADISEYNDAKKNYSEALCRQAQAKYEFIFAIEILKYYKGE